MTREDAVRFLVRRPYKLGHALGFSKLTELHNGWITDMVAGDGDMTLQAHRGSYKTTCVSLALAIMMVLLPNKRLFFMRKTDSDVQEIVGQTKKLLLSPHMAVLTQAIYGVPLKLIKATATELSTNLTTDTRGTAQLVAQGLTGSLTGKHFDRIFTDDIVNLQDRTSKAAREQTKLVYQELQNIKNTGGRIINTGTPWHKDDAFSLMPNLRRYDCYSTGIMTAEEIQDRRDSMAPSLFAANYELRHVAAENVIFSGVNHADDTELAAGGFAHVDAAYGGEDSTAFTVCRKDGGRFYVYGRLWHKHVDDCLADIQADIIRLRAGRLWCEDNGDKGYLAKELRNRGLRAYRYHEDMNKYVKITAYMRPVWREVYFVPGTDPEYIDQILDYNEFTEHDDAPDSLASLIRRQYFRREGTSEPSLLGGLL
jgi:hypothetical protein